MEDKHRQSIMQNLDELVEKTNDEAFEEIRNYFVDKRALNSHMVNKIMNANSSKERKRIFYKMVTKRGPTAYSLLTEALRHSNLQSLSLLLNNHRVFKPMDHCNESSDEADGNCIQAQQQFEENTNDDKTYTATPGFTKGYVLIVNIVDFIGFSSERRNGSEKDVQRLEKVWKKRGFVVIVKTNLKAKEFRESVAKFTSMEELKTADSAVLIVMTHGVSSHPRELLLRMHEWHITVDSEWIIKQFYSTHCKYLVGKPKIIIFQSCRGTDKDRGVAVELDGMNKFPFLNKAIKIVPNMSAILVVYATLPGNVAERHPENGSFFIQLFCEILERYGRLNIEDVLKEVSRGLTEKYEMKQMNYLQGVHVETFRFDKSFYI